MTYKTLVIGASLNVERYSNRAVKALVAHQHPTVALGLKDGIIAGVSIKTGFPELKAIDTVSLYLNPERQKDYYKYIIGLKPRRVIFNPGAENEEFMALLTKNNITFEAACTLVLLATNQF